METGHLGHQAAYSNGFFGCGRKSFELVVRYSSTMALPGHGTYPTTNASTEEKTRSDTRITA